MAQSRLLARGPWSRSQVRVHWLGQAWQPDARASAAADEALHRLRARSSPSHDGLAARMAGFSAAPGDGDGGHLDLDLQPARWALRLVDDERCASLSALCVVRDADGRWLAGRRAAWLATWAGRWALGAGGAVEVGENPVDTLARELHEEWSVTPQRLTAEALIANPTGHVMVVGLARLAAGAEVLADDEHDQHAWWPADVADWPREADEPLRRTATMLAAGDR